MFFAVTGNVFGWMPIEVKPDLEATSNDDYLKTHNIKSKINTNQSLLKSFLTFRGNSRDMNLETKVEAYEDLTEDKLKKEVPISRTGHQNPYNKDYINVPFPIVYGEVDKSPAIPVLKKNNSDNNGASKKLDTPR